MAISKDKLNSVNRLHCPYKTLNSMQSPARFWEFSFNTQFPLYTNNSDLYLLYLVGTYCVFFMVNMIGYTRVNYLLSCKNILNK